MLQGVIFDLGHTLMHLDSTWPEVLQQGNKDLAAFITQEELGILGSAFAQTVVERREEGYSRARKTGREVTAEESMRLAFAQHGVPDPEPSLVSRAIDAFFAFEESCWVAYPGALATLESLAADGFRLGMYSNATHDPFIQRLVDRFGFRPWLEPALSSAGTGIRKPDPAAFAPFLISWELPPESLVMVGDRLEADILGAQRAGMKGIWISAREDARQEGPEPVRPDRNDPIVPTATIGRIEELRPSLEALQPE